MRAGKLPLQGGPFRQTNLSMAHESHSPLDCNGDNGEDSQGLHRFIQSEPKTLE